MKITQYLKTNIEDADIQRFQQSTLQDNIRRGRLLAFASIAFEAVYASIDVIALVFHADNRFHYFIYLSMYCIMILLNILFLLYIRKLDIASLTDRQVKIKQNVLLIYMTALLVWGSIVTLLDQALYGQLIAFLVNMITCSVVFIVNFRSLLIPYILSVLVLAIGLPFFQKSSDVLIGHYVNLEFFIFVSWLASRMIYYFYSHDFTQKLKMEKAAELLEKQIEENKRINAKLSKANQMLKEISLEDDLTGIPNRRCFRAFIDAGLVQKHRGMVLSIIMADIDFFKQYNDHYGHVAGDKVLVTVAQQFNQAVRDPKEFAARWGGEEFIFAAFNANENELFELAETIRKNILALKIRHEYSDVSSYVTVSFGVCSMRIRRNSDISKVIEQADYALYQAKTSGRNCVKRFKAEM